MNKPQPHRPLNDWLGNLIFETKLKAEFSADSMESQFRTPFIVSIYEVIIPHTLTRPSATSYTSSIFFSPIYVHEIIKNLPDAGPLVPTGFPPAYSNTMDARQSHIHVNFLTGASVSSTSLHAGNTWKF